MDRSLPGSSVHRISQAKILEQVDISYSRELPDPGTEPGVSCFHKQILYHYATWKKYPIHRTKIIHFPGESILRPELFKYFN